MAHHLIFEGAELAGKSWLMSQVYDLLEPKYNQGGLLLDGCHWFNCDVGVYGTKHGQPIINNYIKIFQEIKRKNILVEKLHISDIVYNRMHRGQEINYKEAEAQLKKLNFKIILVLFPEKKDELQKRIKDRLKLYPHYVRILREERWYIGMQKEYIRELKKSGLPYLMVQTDKLPDQKPVDKILKWIGEK